ncbi:glycoside hydrolase family 127 protein [Chondrinema litorale]|uniref:glycoside hydrolase family 127 protein n=1 Tax=Chondrinema litorale TaxID=2994555 RepID=UPI0025428E86|nr:beta-L-arabinofuranosidase domain-containing protein [Chondrinema litorale]UZR99416.1 glycoside hydrolase family 127 protein [Chondrinema litorale]
MKKVLELTLIILIIATPFACEQKEKKQDYPIQPVTFTSVQFNDSFWAPKIETNRGTSIPSAFGKCEETGRFHNFALAGGLSDGEHIGNFPFDDTDVYKVLEGASYTLAVQDDKKLDAFLDSVINLIDAAQEEDGYLFTARTNESERLRGWMGSKRWERLNSHELYNTGHLLEAAVAHHEATGKDNLLKIAIKNANLIDQDFGPSEQQKHCPSGHPIVEMALVKLYRETGDDRYLKLAKYFIDETGIATDGHDLSQYSQDHMPVVDQKEAVGHAVRFGYLYSGVTDVAALTGDEAYKKAILNLWDNVASKKLYITGGIGARSMGEGFGENYELPNMTAYCETCASISNVYWNHRMFLLFGDSKYYDVLERTLYNGLIAGISLSGDKFFYDNPLESDGSHDRAPWFDCACCPGNITRFMASVPGYQYAVKDDAVYVNLFATGESELDVEGKKFHLKQTTKYPWEGQVAIEVTKPTGSELDLKIRIPGWAKNEAIPSDLYKFIEGQKGNIKISINGEEVDYKTEQGYAALSKDWEAGDVVLVNLPLEVKRVEAHENVVYDRGKTTFQRGPVVYCFEGVDYDKGSIFSTYVPEGAEVKAEYKKDFLGGVVTLDVAGKGLFKEGETIKEEDVALQAIPYYSWNNRGKSEMLIWMPDNAETAVVRDMNSLTAQATPSVEGYDKGFGLKDGFTPKNSGDVDKNFFFWWLKNGSEEWVKYEFEKPVKISKSDVYWLNYDHYDYTARAPKSWELEYLKGEEWLPVKNKTSYNTELNQFNSVEFEPVTTTAIRLNATMQDSVSAGILEWRVE